MDAPPLHEHLHLDSETAARISTSEVRSASGPRRSKKPFMPGFEEPDVHRHAQPLAYAVATGGGLITWSRHSKGLPLFPSMAAMAMLNISRAVT